MRLIKEIIEELIRSLVIRIGFFIVLIVAVSVVIGETIFSILKMIVMAIGNLL